MSIPLAPYIDHAFASDGKHCPSCKCGQSENYFRFKNQRNQRNIIPKYTPRQSQLMQSRILPNNDPAAMEVGQNVIPNKTVWFKSVSPRPTKITIKISSPDRPNLRPSQVGSSIQKYNNPQGAQLSRVVQINQFPSTPLKNLNAKTNQQYNSESTIYSPFYTQSKNQIGNIRGT